MEYEVMNYEVTKQMTEKKISTEVKERIVAFLMEAIASEFGPEAVGMVRTGNTTKVNEIAFVVGTATDGDEQTSIVVTVNPSVKKFTSGETKRGTYEPFDFIAAKKAYETYINEKEAKAAEAAEKKAKKIAADEAARAKAKAEKG